MLVPSEMFFGMFPYPPVQYTAISQLYQLETVIVIEYVISDIPASTFRAVPSGNLT